MQILNINPEVKRYHKNNLDEKLDYLKIIYEFKTKPLQLSENSGLLFNVTESIVKTNYTVYLVKEFFVSIYLLI